MNQHTSFFQRNTWFVQKDVSGRYYHFTLYKKHRRGSPGGLLLLLENRRCFWEAKESTSTENYSTVAQFSSLFKSDLPILEAKESTGATSNRVPSCLSPPLVNIKAVRSFIQPSLQRSDILVRTINPWARTIIFGTVDRTSKYRAADTPHYIGVLVLVSYKLARDHHRTRNNY